MRRPVWAASGHEPDNFVILSEDFVRGRTKSQSKDPCLLTRSPCRKSPRALAAQPRSCLIFLARRFSPRGALNYYYCADNINDATIFFVSSSIASIGFFEPFDAFNPLIPMYTASYGVSPRFSTL